MYSHVGTHSSEREGTSLRDDDAATTERPISIGVLAHIDAGKTSLTERLLFETGVIDQLGTVDDGTTQTDTNDIERRRGITIRAAVTSFAHRGQQVDVIDTPGHSEFVAEVQRALAVLDGVVLVISAVEGIQAHTKVLMSTLRRMQMPTLIFVNKIDRSGANAETVLRDIAAWLDIDVVPMSEVEGEGGPCARSTPLDCSEAWRESTAETLSEHDIGLLDDLVANREIEPGRLCALLRKQTSAGRVCPVYFGSARTGEGATQLLDGIVGLLEPPQGHADGPPRGVVFAIEHPPASQKAALVRLDEGVLRTREVADLHRMGSDGEIVDLSSRVTAIHVIGGGEATSLQPGHLARVYGLHDARVGDQIGVVPCGETRSLFAPPTLEAVVRPEQPDQASALHAALVALAEQDPLIATRVHNDGALSVLLYGEIQKEVLSETLVNDFHVSAQFEPSSIVHLERPTGSGSLIVPMGRTRFVAGIGLRIDPAPLGSGITYRRETEYGALTHAFHIAIEQTVLSALRQGLHGWPVTDCHVTLVHSEFDNACSTGGDFRLLTPLVVLGALRRAGSSVHEPCQAFEMDVPAHALSAVTSELLRMEAAIEDTRGRRDRWAIHGTIPLRRVQALTMALPSLTSGEGSCVFWPGGDRVVHGEVPTRERDDGNPLRLKEYLHYLSGRQHRGAS